MDFINFHQILLILRHKTMQNEKFKFTCEGTSLISKLIFGSDLSAFSGTLCVGFGRLESLLKWHT